MSTIKVNKIENTGTTAGGVEIDSSGHVQVDGQQFPTAGALSNRNLVINGGMQVSQRSTSTAVTTTDTFVLDRFKAASGSSFNLNSTISQSSTAPAGFANSFKVDVTTVSTPSGGENGVIFHRIEAQNLQHLQYGTSSAQTCTASFWVRSNKTGTYCFQLLQDDAQKYVLYEYTISSANTWEKKTITIVGNTADAIANDNGPGIELRWHLASGSTDHVSTSSTWTGNTAGYLTTSNQVNLFDNTSNEWYLTGVQFEVGEKATPFEHRSYGDELQRCQRYYEELPSGAKIFMALNANSTASAYSNGNVIFKVTKRATPTVVTSTTSGNNSTAISSEADEAITAYGFAVTGQAQAADAYYINSFTADAEL